VGGSRQLVLAGLGAGLLRTDISTDGYCTARCTPGAGQRRGLPHGGSLIAVRAAEDKSNVPLRYAGARRPPERELVAGNPHGRGIVAAKGHAEGGVRVGDFSAAIGDDDEIANRLEYGSPLDPHHHLGRSG
jgi:hypothetical protein